MLLSGLHPATDYHYRINAWDGVGYLAASSDFAFRTAVDGPATLLGDQTVQTERVTLAAGPAASYQDRSPQRGHGSGEGPHPGTGPNATGGQGGRHSRPPAAPGASPS